jgi:TRAP transporter TAXI family solute receptor
MTIAEALPKTERLALKTIFDARKVLRNARDELQRSNTMRWKFLTALGVIMVLGSTVSGSATYAATSVVWLGGPKGGGWFAMAEGLAKLINSENPDLALSVEPGGGKDNPDSVEKGKGQIAMSIDFLVAAARNGKAPYTEASPKLNTLGVGWSPLPFHLLAAKDKTGDLRKAITGKGFRIALPQKDTSDELTFTRVMEFYGTSYAKIAENGGSVIHGDYNQIVSAIKDGSADYLFGATTKPAAIITEVGEGPRPIVLESMPVDLMDFLQTTYGYGRGKIEAKTYPKLQSQDVTTTFMETVFIISSDVPDDVAYKVTKTLIASRAKLPAINASMSDYNPGTAWKNLPVPLHPGAERAYRELGFMK